MARAWPVQPRDGFTGLPNAILARAIGELTPEQLRLFLGLVYSAEWRTEGGTSPDGRWLVGCGQVLVSYEGLAAKYAMTVDAVRRALRRFEGVAVATSRRASPATPAATSPATPPTLVDFGSWYGIRATEAEGATPPATRGATPPATSPPTIQQGNTEHDHPPLRSGGDAAAPAAAPPEQAATAPSEFQTVVRHWFAAWERAGRGKHTSLTGADGLNLKRLVRELGAGEVMARMDRALSDPWFLERADLALFFRQRNRFASPGRAAAPVAADWGRMAAAMRGPELRAIGEELFRRSATFPQLGRAVEILADVPGTMVGDVLVLEARDEFQRQRLADSVGQLLLEIAPDVLGRAVSIDVVTRLHTAAGVAR